MKFTEVKEQGRPISRSEVTLRTDRTYKITLDTEDMGNVLVQILIELRQIKFHLAAMSGEPIDEEDVT